MERNSTKPRSRNSALHDAAIGVRAGWNAWRDIQTGQARADTARALFDRHFAGLEHTTTGTGRGAAAADVEIATARPRSGLGERFATAVLPLVLIGTALALAGFAAEANEVGAIAQVQTMPTEERPAARIDSASAWVRVDADGVTMTMDTADLFPGNVTTAWWVIVTAPENCQANPCAPKEIIARAAEIGTQISYADGAVNGPDGTAQFSAYLPQGPVAGGWFDPGFDDPMTAEVHVVLNDHGPLVPELAASMLTTYRGGCRDNSLPPPFPASAKADGLPGPNACQLIQAAIFLPGGKPANAH